MEKPVIDIRPIMNSCAEEILAFKTCCGLKMFEQNLEIHVDNRDTQPVVIYSYFDIEGDQGRKRITTLIPSGSQTIEPGEVKAFYTCMDETLWNSSHKLIFYDSHGREYPVFINTL